MSMKGCDFLIAGAGIIGLTIARDLKNKYPGAEILLIEKESEIALHGSGRNSGVLHAGFYYTADSLKARFTRDGNASLTQYCEDHGLRINDCGKVVVTRSEDELQGLLELKRRGDVNGVKLDLIDAYELQQIEPNASTFESAIYSPATKTVDPTEVCAMIAQELDEKGVHISFEEGFRSRAGESKIKTSSSRQIEYKEKFINCTGLYADKVAREFGFSNGYTILPFKGIYLKYTKNDQPIRTNIYPIPNLANPFLGVHYTITVDNHIKIGPTAIPAFWRENYKGFTRFSFSEFIDISRTEMSLLLKNSFNFRKLAFSELKKYWKPVFTNLARDLVQSIDTRGFTEWSKPGIRAQLLNTTTDELVQDFVVEGDQNSVHVLNAVSPAFTCSIPFANYVVENYIKNEGL